MPRSAALKRFLDAVRHGGRVRVHVDGVSSSALHFLAALLHGETDRNVMVVVRDGNRAQALYDELRQLLADGREWAGVLHLPRTSVSPYIEVTADSRLALQVLGTLGHLALDRPAQVVVVPVTQLARPLPRPDAVRQASYLLEKGEEVDREDFIQFLVNAGYARVNTVFEEGSFAVRGSLLDLFGPGMTQPVRVDFFGDEVEAISPFVTETQITTGRVDSVHILPATEVLNRGTTLSRARAELLALADAQNLPTSRLAELTNALHGGELPPGTEALLPVLLGKTAHLTDYLDPADWLVLYEDHAQLERALTEHREAEERRYAAYRDLGRLALPPDRLLRSLDGLALDRYTQVNSSPLDTAANVHHSIQMTRPLADVEAESSKWGRFEELARERVRMGYHVAVGVQDLDEGHKLAHLIARDDFFARVEEAPLTWGTIDKLSPFRGVRFYASALFDGVESVDLGWYFVTSRELFDRRGPRRASRPETASAHQEKMLSLQEGEYVVHQDYGIGRFTGVMRRVMGSAEYTCLQIEYNGADTLYVPIHNASVVQKYVGSGSAGPKLDKLGGASWTKRVEKVRKAAKKLAFDLLKLYARRQAAHGYAYSAPDDYFAQFSAGFPYEETPDQRKAIEDVLGDMEKPQPMDRLVCGDVGFGKTEVALRAAFKAILDGRQVAVLVPTTVLAEQHSITFAGRLKSYPVTVASLSRFKSKAEQREVLAGLAQGSVDVVIGTHRLLSDDITFKSLGLVIIDEEHRFGVGHKEKLKALRTTVDVLSMTATPIPRTMHMALSGIRDLSVIQTPPPGRQDIRTTVLHFDPDTLAEAIRLELGRKGQIFFLHNRVEDIETVREQLQGLVPEARILVAHGQMAEQTLEKAMVRFMNHEADIMLCTTIIESGLDIPSVNTLIVNNAHMFGLAQLYQIRGRVGRSSRQAFAYFIVPPMASMSTDARSRLATLTKFTAVGSGFQVANIDMELRGAGSLLGGDQSGHVSSVGFDMYVHLLQDAVEELKEEHGVARRVECRLEVPVEADLPAEYIDDHHIRLVFYRRIAGADSPESLEALHLEMRDRFGPIPEPARNLLTVAELKVRAQRLGLARLEAGPTGIAKADLSQAPDAVLEAALTLVRNQPAPVKVVAPHSLVVDLSAASQPGALHAARRVVTLLEEARPPGRTG